MKKVLCVLCVALLSLAFAVTAGAEEVQSPSAALTAATSTAWIPALADQEQVIFQGRESRSEDTLTGCTAQITCKSDPDGNPPPPFEVTCSSGTPGTCSAYYGNCGTVVCNGVLKRCPGYCLGAHNCLNYCFPLENNTCQNGCCVCN